MAQRKVMPHDKYWFKLGRLLQSTKLRYGHKGNARIKLLATFTICVILITTMPIFNRHVTRNIKSWKTSQRFSTFSPEKVTLYWPHPFPCPANEIKQLVQKLQNDADVEVYAASDECIESLENTAITKFLHLHSVCEDTPVSLWLRRHVHFKLIAGFHYGDQLRHVIMACLLHKRPGAVVDLSIGSKAINTLICDTKLNTSWIAVNISAVNSKMLGFAKFILSDFLANYPPSPMMKNSPFPLHYNFWTNLSKLAKSQSIDSIFVKDVEEFVIPKKYAIFSFNQRIALVTHGNMGDEIQNFAGLQFFPHIDLLVEREGLQQVTERNVTVFMNAWLGDYRFRWGRDGFVEPIMVSVHLEGNWYEEAESIAYMKRYEPIGARDTSTTYVLKSLAIKNFFSGCATILIDNPRKLEARTSHIYAVDVDDNILRQILPENIYKTVIVLKHRMSRNDFDQFGRYVNASERVFEMYATAKLVITSRIHAAMPCVGLGTPVIFVLTNHLPGGGQSRLMGLTSMWHLVKIDGEKGNVEAARKQMEAFDWQHPPPNPNALLQQQLRSQQLKKIFEGRSDLRNTAKMFSMSIDNFDDQ